MALPIVNGTGALALLLEPRDAAQQRAHAREQHGQRERLGQIVVGAQVEAAHDVARRVTRGQQQHRHVTVVRAQPRDDVEAGDPGQHHVEEHQIDRRRALVREALERRLAAIGDLHAVALGLQVEGQAAREVLLVLNEENALWFRHFREASG